MSDITQPPAFKPSAPVSPGSILRSEFDRLSSADRVRCMKEGWTVRDDPETARKPVTISRDIYDKMPAAGRAEFDRRGGLVAD